MNLIKARIIMLNCVVLLCCCTAVIGQNLAFGPRTGVNIIHTYHNTYDKNLYSFGYDLGVFAERRVYNNFYVGLACNLTQKKLAFNSYSTGSFFETVDAFLAGFGSMLPVEISIEDILESTLGTSADLINDTVYNYSKGMTHFYYIELPLTVSYRYKRFTVEAGPVFSFLSGSTTYSVTKQEVPLLDMLPAEVFDTLEYGAYIYGTMVSLFPAYKDTVLDETSAAKGIAGFNLGLTAGLRYEMYDNLFLTVNYGHMFTDIYTDASRKSKHSLFNIGLRYNLGGLLKGKPLL